MAVLRPHLALTVTDVERSIPFYEALFGTEPQKRRPGYAKFSVAEPALNFTLTQGMRAELGAFNHAGIQVQTTADVLAARERLTSAGLAAFDEMDTTCCYARQDKIWVRDPDGTPWEVFVTHEDTEAEHESCGCGESSATECCSGDRGVLRVSDELQLNDAQTLYRRWEEEQWSPFTIDLSTDQRQWGGLAEDQRELIHFVLSSLMVAEERITTKFSGLVAAADDEEEATFLSSQQIDEARHMQFYARFQDEVVASPAEIAAHVDRARSQVSEAFRQIFDVALVEAHDQLIARPDDPDAKIRFVTLYHLVLEGTLGLTSFKFITDYLNDNGLLPGFVAGYSKIHHDETRHIGYGVWFLREAVRDNPELQDTMRRTLRDLLPHVAATLKLPGDGDASDVLGVSEDDLRAFALNGLTRRLAIIGVPLETVFA